MRLRLIITALTFFFGLMALPVLAEDDPQTQIQTVIENQIAAFKNDDFAQAFSYASPSIQSMFGTAENFGVMVQRGYPMVWRPADVQFMDLREMAGDLWQHVLIRDQAGRRHMLLYRMQKGPEGWLINGVQLGKPIDQLT